MYSGILNNLRGVMIRKMAKPQEVYIQFDQETGEVTREYEVDTGNVNFDVTYLHIVYPGVCNLC